MYIEWNSGFGGCKCMMVAGWCVEVEQWTMYDCSMNRLDYSMRGLVSHNGAKILSQFKIFPKHQLGIQKFWTFMDVWKHCNSCKFLLKYQTCAIVLTFWKQFLCFQWYFFENSVLQYGYTVMIWMQWHRNFRTQSLTSRSECKIIWYRHSSAYTVL